MRVRLLLRLEPAVSGSVWTAESPDVPGFYAARGSLDELVSVVETAVREILREGGWTGEVAFEYEAFRTSRRCRPLPRPDAGATAHPHSTGRASPSTNNWSTIPTTTARMGASGTPTTWRAPLPSSRISTVSW